MYVFFFFKYRFSQFFVSPLVKMEAMEREVLAVDSGGPSCGYSSQK